MRYLTIIFMSFLLYACDSADKSVEDFAKKTIAESQYAQGNPKFTNIYTVRWQGVVNNKVNYGNVAVCGEMETRDTNDKKIEKRRFVVELSDNDQTSSPNVKSVNIEREDLKRAVLSTKSTSNSESLFELLYWNMRCVDQQHQKTFTGLH